MAAIADFMIKREEQASELTLTTEPGQSILVKDVLFDEGSEAAPGEVFVDRSSVLWVENTGVDGRYPLKANKARHPSLVRYLQTKGIHTEIPVAEGQTLTVKTGMAIGAIEVIYELHKAGDITKDMPNGTNWKEWTFVNWGKFSGNVSPTAWHTYDVSMNPGPYPDFPFGAVVPSKVEVDLLGLLLRLAERNTYTGSTDTYARTAYLKLVKGTDVLFDNDLYGFLAEGTGAAAGSANAVTNTGLSELTMFRGDVNEPLFLFPTPIVFEAGEELHVELYVTGDSGAYLLDNDAIVGAILRYRKV